MTLLELGFLAKFEFVITCRFAESNAWSVVGATADILGGNQKRLELTQNRYRSLDTKA